MCMMCEQEALYDAYLEYVARKEAEAAGKGDVIKSDAIKSAAFSAEAVEDDAPEDLTVVRAPPVATSKEN